jgi:VIT1/CCC1 family predicted Fe2+/Mn2+ transporter
MKPKNRLLVFLIGFLIQGSIVFLGFFFLIKNSLIVSVIGAIVVGLVFGFYFQHLSNRSFKKSQSNKQ